MSSNLPQITSANSRAISQRLEPTQATIPTDTLEARLGNRLLSKPKPEISVLQSGLNSRKVQPLLPDPHYHNPFKAILAQAEVAEVVPKKGKFDPIPYYLNASERVTVVKENPAYSWICSIWLYNLQSNRS